MVIHRKTRRANSIARKITGAVLFFVAVLALGIVCIFTRHREKQISYIIASDPYIVASWDKETHRFTLLTFPTDTVIEGAHGYGSYSLQSLWDLGLIDKTKGKLIQDSLSDTLAISLSGYVGPSQGATFVDSKDPVTMVKRAVSFTAAGKSTVGKYVSNISVLDHLSFGLAFLFTRPDKINVIDLSSINVLIEEQLPDGSLRHSIDRDRLDYVLLDIFEDTQIRQESIPVIVLNTTSTPSLGTRASRYLTRVGIRVVSIGNDDSSEVPTCVISGTKEARQSYTAHRIQEIFHCVFTDKQEDYPGDLIVRIGTSYQQLFYPSSL